MPSTWTILFSHEGGLAKISEIVVLMGLGPLGRKPTIIKTIAIVAKTSAITAIFFADNKTESKDKRENLAIK